RARQKSNKKVQKNAPVTLLARYKRISKKVLKFSPSYKQRTKSWSCENCKNFKEIKNMNICKECFWAYPENYNHIAMHPQRRLDIVFNNDDIDIYDKMDTLSKENNKSVQILIKEAISLYLKHKS
ncbi:hypothetical protein, partial [Snodgrassella communis]|uniref:hypothetical protein n=1 Tax=Snodgrassella communis TaxID=2946699 RepID=UPI001EF42363